MFSRISGTTAISGAVDSSFTLVEERRGSGRARLSCIGRDIEYRELELHRGDENVWELVSDSDEQTRFPGSQIVPLLCELLDSCSEFIGTPRELSKRIDPDGSKSCTPKKVRGQIVKSAAALGKAGITFTIRRSNGKRLIELHRAGSDDAAESPEVDPCGTGEGLVKLTNAKVDQGVESIAG